MDKELISIIVPVYNAEKYLRECLNSLIGQTYKNLEIILVNDGSTDLSRNICLEYVSKDSRIRLIDKENEGLSIARERGISSANGIYFATVDSDDVVHEDYIKKMYDQITEENADICLCARKEFTNDKEAPVYLDKRIEKCRQVTKEDLIEEYAALARTYQMSDSWNKLYRREFVKNTNVHFCLGRQYNGTDLLFNYMLLLHCPKIATINEILYYYRIVPNSIVRKKNKPLQQGFHIILDKLLNEIEICELDAKIKQQISVIYVSMIKYTTLDIVLECDNRKDMKKRLQTCVAESYNFISSRGLKGNISKLLPNHLKVFYFLLRNRMSEGIFLYYMARKAIRG